MADPLTPALLAALLGAADAAAPAGAHAAAAPGVAPGVAPEVAPEVDFTRDVAPLLAARCYQCHGPDASSRKAGLRLDRRDAATAAPRTAATAAAARRAIVPGDPDASELIARVTSADPDERMPPVDGHAALTAAEVAVLRAWIAAGAPYAKHWSWEPLPAGGGDAPLDASPLLASAGAEVAPAAWLRRAHFDIVGLPPSPDEVRGFVAACAAGPAAVRAARERAVDALLASPRFGERWGRHWLDVMRYSETLGHEFDYPVEHAWRWRDWVIGALNADMPYAEFVRAQVAGDLLGGPDGPDGAVATGWWWMTQGTHAPVDVRLDQAERIDNQIDVASKAFLGTTASCARCHDHKFDDVSQRDYYALFGVVRSSRRAFAYQDPGGAIRAAVGRLAAVRDGALAASPQPTEWDRDRARRAAPPAPAGATWSFDGGSFEGWTASGWAFGDAPLACGDRFAPDGAAPHTAVGGWAHSGALSGRLHGTLRSPTFTVPEHGIGVRCAGAGCRVRLVVDGYYLDDRNALLFENFLQAVDHPGEWRTHAWDARRYAGEQAYLEVIDDGDGFVAIDWVSLGIVTGADLQPAPFPCAPAEASAAAKAVDVPAPVRVLAMEDGTGLDSPLYERGVPANAAGAVPRGMIAGLRTAGGAAASASANAPSASGRAELAAEIVSPANPLTWRVMANRVWHHMTGRGIVASTDDFGVLGQAPSEQALLDALAARLRACGSVKSLVREIALSPRYASAARGMRRLDAEALRDATIAVAGGLDLAAGGPSVPIHLTDAMQGRGRPAEGGPLDGARRRSVYLEVRRNFLSPYLLAFDHPVPTTTVGARSVSNVPSQGLTLLNDPFVRGQAERWGASLAADARPAGARVADAFLRAYGREGTADEVAGAIAFVRAADGGESAADAWADLAHGIFLSTEFRYLP